MKLNIFQLRISNWKCYFLFSNFELVTRKRKKKRLTFELVTANKTFDFLTLFIFRLQVSNSKVKKSKYNFRVSNLKFDLIFYIVELVTQKKNFCKHFQVSNWKRDVILCNSVC